MKLLQLILRCPLTLAISLACLLLFLFFNDHSASSVNSGRLDCIGGQFLHWSGEHLFWDLGMFAVLGFACESFAKKRYYGTLLIAMFLVPLGVAIFHPELQSYRGLSGLDTAIFSLFATVMLTRSLRNNELAQALLFGSMLILVFGKTLFEFTSGGVLFVQEANFTPTPAAHLVGALIGIVFAILPNVRQRPLRRSFVLERKTT